MEWLKQACKIIVYVFIVLSTFLLSSDLESIKYENSLLLLSCNLLFLGFIPFVVSIMAFRVHVKHISYSALFFGCGMLLLGYGGIFAGTLGYVAPSPNIMVSVYNICAFFASLCHLFSAVQYDYIAQDFEAETKKGALLKIGTILGVVALFVLSIVYLVVAGLLPAFIDIHGFTSTRYIVISMAIAFYFAAAMIYWKQYRKHKSDVYFWYALSLLMMSLGLLNAGMASSLNTLLNWLGRFAQYTGAGFAVIAIISMLKKAKSTGTTVADIMMDFFSDGQTTYMNLINASPDAIVSIDQTGEIFIANASAYKLLGLNKDSNGYMTFLDVLEQPYRDEVRNQLVIYAQNGKSELINTTKEILIKNSMGRVFPVEISFSGRRMESKYAITMIIRDITERHSEKKALALVEELKKADQNKNEFIGVMSHELRNPLAAIVAGLNLMDMTQNTEQITKTKVMIDRQIKHLCKLVDDLLDLTRITQNRIVLNKERVDLNEIAREVIHDIKTQYEKKGVQLESEMKGVPLFLTADPVRIAQVIVNLLTNGLKFTQTTGKVTLTLDHEGNEAVIKVKDNGAGMSHEIINDVFNAFVQSEKTLHRSDGGLGLGLSIVKGIVDLHGGQISAVSEGPDKGSEFIVRLPISERISNNTTIEENQNGQWNSALSEDIAN